MHNNSYLVALTSLYNHTKLELCTFPYPELALDRGMEQNFPFTPPNAPLSSSAWTNTSIEPSKHAGKMPPSKN